MKGNPRVATLTKSTKGFEDHDTLTVTYGEIRRYAREGQLVREAWSEDLRRAENSEEHWRRRALSIEPSVLRRHTGRRGEPCATCGHPAPCPIRREVQKIARDMERELERDQAEAVTRAGILADNRRVMLARAGSFPR